MYRGGMRGPDGGNPRDSRPTVHLHRGQRMSGCGDDLPHGFWEGLEDERAAVRAGALRRRRGCFQDVLDESLLALQRLFAH